MTPATAASTLLPSRPLDSLESGLVMQIHRSLGLAELWGHLQNVFETLLPHDTLVLSHGYRDWRQEATTYRLTSAHSRVPDDGAQQRLVVEEGRQFFQPFLDRHPGIPCYRHTQVLSNPLAVTSTRYYERFMRPLGWRYSAHLLYWHHGQITTSIALRRRPEQGDFTDNEMALLAALQEPVGIALERTARYEQESRARRLIEGYHRRQPEAVMFLDPGLAPIYLSQEAVALCAIWNLGRAQARRYRPESVYALPPAIAGACEELRRSATSAPVGDAPRPEPPPRTIAVLSPCGLCEAAVALRHDGRGALSQPVFIVRLRKTITAEPAAPMADSHNLLAQLTPTERELATLVCQGLSNKEIATRLHKTEGSVKVQISGIYHKLGVGNRAQLILRLR